MMRPAPPLPALTTIFNGLRFLQIDVRQQVLDIRLHGVDRLTAHAWLRGVGKLGALGECTDLFNPLSPLMGFDCSRTNFMPL